MSGLRLSLLITFFSSNGSTAIFFLVTLVLARLLSPAEVGIFSMTAVLIGIAHTFRDFGVSSYMLQEKDLTPQKIRSASGVMFTTSWLMGALMFAASGAAAEFLKQPATKEVMQVLATGFFFIPFGSVTHTLLTRDYKAQAQAVVYFTGTGAYAVSALWLAFTGHSYMSMAWANLINILTCAVSYAFFRPRNAPWLPSFSGWKNVTNFSVGAIAGGTLGQINQALPDIWLGKSSGAHDVGLLSRANGTAGIFMQIAGPTVNYAALPHLAQQYHRGEALAPTLCKATAYLSVCSWPPLVVTAIYSREVILLLYGAQWLECTPLVELLCISTCIAMTSHFHVPALQAIGRPFSAVAPHLALLIMRIACILAIYDGTLISFGWGLLVASAITVPFNMLIQAKYFDIGVEAFVRALLPSFAVTTACSVVAWILHMATPATWPVFVKLLVLAIVLCPLWICAVALARHPFAEEFKRIGAKYPAFARALGLITRKG